MSHYFVTPAGDFETTTVTARFWDTDWTFHTAPGVFSGRGLDLGTSVLLRTCPPPSGNKRVLDLGCGFGIIGIALAVANERLNVTSVDVNERALTLTRMNAKHHGVLDQMTVCQPDAVPDGTFDEIWSNPPIRIGKTALHDLLTTWLARLAPDGIANLVVGKNLGADSLQRWLTDQGYSCDRLASAKGFRVFQVCNR